MKINEDFYNEEISEEELKYFDENKGNCTKCGGSTKTIKIYPDYIEEFDRYYYRHRNIVVEHKCNNCGYDNIMTFV